MLDPRIGQLNSGRYYCFPDGYAQPEFVGTLSAVQQKLGLAPFATTQAKPSDLRKYKVLVTPRVTVYAGAWVGGEYSIEVFARSRNDAIAAARRERAEEEGRLAVPARYRARRID